MICKWTCCCRPETAEENLLESPAGDRKPFLPASSNQRVIPSKCSASYFNYIHVYVLKYGISDKFPFEAEQFVMFLFLPTFLLPFLSVCNCVWRLLPVVRIRTQSCLKSLKSCRWVASPLILCSVQWRLSKRSFLSSYQYSPRPSGQQDRWAAVWIPSSSEGESSTWE